ncbi:hypothetical protein BD770DRAFT_418736 [Pilaira anomala]|nr:hypothetical protein BD770DRAFT_418736 [Pilaira anomala]
MSTINVNIKSSSDKKFIISIETEKTVLDLKNTIAEQTQVPAERQRLIYSGRVLKDHDTLADCKIADAAAATTTTASVATASPTTPTNTTTTTPPNTTQSMPVDPQSNPFNMFGSGFGAGAMGNSFGGMDPNMTNQMLQNPMFAQYMSTVLQNPAVLDSIIQTNPQLSSMGPEIRNMMQSPEFRQMLSNPDMIRQMATMASAAGGAGAAGVGGGGFPGFGNVPPVDPQLQQRMAALFGTPGTSPAAVTDTRSPEERFQVQLQQLNEMGFWDAAKNIRVLTATGGNVNAAIEMLFNNPN